MRPFDYLSILVSIIVALGITALLSNAARYIRLRDEIVGYAPAAVWGVTLFLLLVQIWWVSFYRRDIGSFTFFGFILYLMIPVLVALLSHLVLSDLAPGTNVEGEFLKVRTGSTRFDANFAFRCEFLALAAVGLFVRSRAA
jgi:hypothetical protein